jgi:hypothetical protein
VTDLPISHFLVKLLNFKLERKLSKRLETTVIQFTLGHIPRISSLNTLQFLSRPSKQFLSKRLRHVHTLCSCFLLIINYIWYPSQYVWVNYCNVNRIKKHHVSAPMAVTVEINGFEIFETSLTQHLVLLYQLLSWNYWARRNYFVLRDICSICICIAFILNNFSLY